MHRSACRFDRWAAGAGVPGPGAWARRTGSDPTGDPEPGSGRSRPADAGRASPPGGAATDRVSDADRERVVALLGDAAAEGYLQLEELEDRLGRAWAARTRADLDGLVADLPTGWLARRAARDAADGARRAARAALRWHAGSYAGVMALLVTIWLVVGLTAGAWYPWPVWPALGWGIGLVGHLRAAYARPAAP